MIWIHRHSVFNSPINQSMINILLVVAQRAFALSLARVIGIDFENVVKMSFFYFNFVVG